MTPRSRSSRSRPQLSTLVPGLKRFLEARTPQTWCSTTNLRRSRSGLLAVLHQTHSRSSTLVSPPCLRHRFRLLFPPITARLLMASRLCSRINTSSSHLRYLSARMSTVSVKSSRAAASVATSARMAAKEQYRLCGPGMSVILSMRMCTSDPLWHASKYDSITVPHAQLRRSSFLSGTPLRREYEQVAVARSVPL